MNHPRLLLAVTGLSLLAGCGAAHVDSAALVETVPSIVHSTPVESVPAASAAATTHLRTIHETIGLTDEQHRMVLDAFTAHQTSCMQTAGYEVDLPTPGPLVTKPTSGPPTAEELATSGYRWRAVRIEDAAAASAAPTSRSAAEQSALDKCSITAQRAIGLDRLAPLDGELGAAENTIMQQALDDPSYNSALTAWAACMAESDYPVADQDAAISFAGKLPGGLSRAQGIAVAVRDYECQTESGLAATLADVVASATDAWVTANPDTVSRYRAATAAVIAAIA